MLMLQRAAENVNPSECNDPAVLLACSLGSDSCPAACQKKADEKTSDDEPTASNISDMPIAWDLTIAVADYSDSIRSVPAVATVVMNAVDFKASEKVTIESVKLERTGLSDKSAIKWVWFEKDGIAVSAKASLSTDGVATTRFYNNYSVNGTDTLDLVVELSGSAGSEIAFKIIDVVSTAKNVSANTQTSTVRTTAYEVAKIGFKQNGSANVSYKVGEKKSYEIWVFELNNDKWNGSEDKSIVVKSLKLKNASGLNLADTFKNVYVTRDSKTVSKNVTLDSKDITIVFDDDVIESGRKGIYTIYAEVAQLTEVNEAVQLKLNKTTDLVAQEKWTNFRTAYTTATVNGLKLWLYTFKGGKVTFTNDSSLTKTIEAAADSSDVVIAKGTLTVSEPVKLEDFKIVTTTPAEAKAHIKNIKLEVNGSTYTTNTFDNSANAFTFDDDIYVSKTSSIRVLVDLNNDAAVETIKFNNLNGASFGAGTYENSDETLNISDIAGSISISNLTVKAGKFYITNKSSAAQKVVAGNTDEVTIFDWEITAKSGKVTVNKLVLTGDYTITAGSSTSADQITVTLHVNWEPFEDEIYKLWDHYIKFANLGDLTSSSSMKIKITAQPNIATAEGSVTFEVWAEGRDENGNDVVATSTNASKLEITGEATATVASASSSSTVILDGSNAELVSFNATVKDGSYDLTGVTVVLSSAVAALDWQSMTLKVDGSSVGSAKYVWTSNSIVINNLNESLAIGKHTFVVEANANVDKAGQAIVDVKSVQLNNDTPKTMSVKKLITKAYPVISASKSTPTLTLTISNPEDNNEDFEIVGFDIDWKITYASFDGASVTPVSDLNKAIAEKQLSLSDKDSTKLVIDAAKNETVKVTAIHIKIGSNIIKLDSTYTNIGDWDSFRVSGGDNGSTNSGSVTPANTATTISLAADDTNHKFTATIVAGTDGDSKAITWSVMSGTVALTSSDYTTDATSLTITAPVTWVTYTATWSLANGKSASDSFVWL